VDANSELPPAAPAQPKPDPTKAEFEDAILDLQVDLNAVINGKRTGPALTALIRVTAQVIATGYSRERHLKILHAVMVMLGLRVTAITNLEIGAERGRTSEVPPV
jgi:hypothetical protein